MGSAKLPESTTQSQSYIPTMMSTTNEIPLLACGRTKLSILDLVGTRTVDLYPTCAIETNSGIPFYDLANFSLMGARLGELYS